MKTSRMKLENLIVNAGDCIINRHTGELFIVDKVDPRGYQSYDGWRPEITFRWVDGPEYVHRKVSVWQGFLVTEDWELSSAPPAESA